MKIEIKNASVIGLHEVTVKTLKGEMVKQTATLCINTASGAETHGVEVWGEDIEKFALTQGEMVNISCRLIGKVWEGRWNYTLSAYFVERIQKEARQ